MRVHFLMGGSVSREKWISCYRSHRHLHHSSRALSPAKVTSYCWEGFTSKPGIINKLTGADSGKSDLNPPDTRYADLLHANKVHKLHTMKLEIRIACRHLQWIQEKSI